MEKIALQMWSLHTLTEKDFFGTLEAVKKIGFDNIELAGCYDKSAAEMKEKLENLQLNAVSEHIGYDKIIADFDEIVSFAKVIGCKNIVSPGIPVSDKTSRDSWKEAAERLNNLGRRLLESGIRLGYQNHDHEFLSVGEESGLGILIKETDPKLVFFELETFWSFYSNFDPIDLIKKYPGRFYTIHLKDMKRKGTKINTILGDGIMDIPGIIKVAKNYGGTEIFITKQENYEEDELKALERGLQNIKLML